MMLPNDSHDQPTCANADCDGSISLAIASVGRCPQSGNKGRLVDTATVKAMLAVSLTEVRETSYFFCKDAECPVVYFSEDGTQIFTTQQIRERVYQKEPESSDVLICYCFRHTRNSIREELITTGQTTVVEGINAGIQLGQCACDIRNPQGSCCLGNVSVLLKDISQSLYHKDK